MSKTAGGDIVPGSVSNSYIALISLVSPNFVRSGSPVGLGNINMTNFEEGLGRVMYVVGALEYERPFLAPLYKFMALHARGTVRRVPAYVSFYARLFITKD